MIRERLLPVLAGEMDHELVFAAALGMIVGPATGDHLEPLLEALAAVDDECRAAMVRALQLAPLADVEVMQSSLAGDTEPALRAAVVEVLAFHRADLSAQLPALLQDDDATVRARALVAARGPLGAPVLPLIARALDDPSAEVRQAALEAGQEAGGDRRGMQSAAMLIVQKDGGVWLNNDVVLRLQVDDHEQPIVELRRLIEMAAEQRARASRLR